MNNQPRHHFERYFSTSPGRNPSIQKPSKKRPGKILHDVFKIGGKQQNITWDLLDPIGLAYRKKNKHLIFFQLPILLRIFFSGRFSYVGFFGFGDFALFPMASRGPRAWCPSVRPSFPLAALLPPDPPTHRNRSPKPVWMTWTMKSSLVDDGILMMAIL